MPEKVQCLVILLVGRHFIFLAKPDCNLELLASKHNLNIRCPREVVLAVRGQHIEFTAHNTSHLHVINFIIRLLLVIISENEKKCKKINDIININV
jgi:hypothetical protein